MEQATLRPVPLRPAGPVVPAEALAHVLEALPDLDADAARALSLIEIAGRTRDQAGDEAGLAATALADALYRARKALRRSIFPLSASGWCERAERLLSDRIDGVLRPPGPARLDVHMRNCERCVDHERRLSQARERLVRGFIDAHPHAAGAGPAERAGVAELRVVEIAAAREPEPAYDGPTRTVPGFGGPMLEPLPAAAEPLPEPAFAGPGGQVEIVPEPQRRIEAGAVAAEAQPDDPPIEQDVAPAEPGDATPSESDADAPSEPVVDRDAGAAVADAAIADAAIPDAAVAGAEAAPPPSSPRGIQIQPAAAIWGTLTLLSVALAVFALVVTVLAISGLERIF